MLNITDAAVTKLHSFELADLHADSIRLSVKGGGCSGFQYSLVLVTRGLDFRPTDNIRCFRDSQSRVLTVLIDTISMTFVKDLTIDYRETLLKSGFVFENPDVKTTCGCGSSFGV